MMSRSLGVCHFSLGSVNREANVAAYCCVKFACPVNREMLCG
jgi:hypothetical protein